MSSTMPPTSNIQELRTIIRRLFPIDSDFDAFCLDCFPGIYEHFASGMDRVHKENLLFSVVRICPALLSDALIRYAPEVVEQNPHLFTIGLKVPEDKIAAYFSVVVTHRKSRSLIRTKRIKKEMKRLWRRIRFSLVLIGLCRVIEWLTSLINLTPKHPKEYLDKIRKT